MYRKTLSLFLAIALPMLSLSSCRTPPAASAGTGTGEGLPQTAVYGLVMNHMASAHGSVPKVLDLVDHEGHVSGFSPDNPAYVAAASRAFGMVETLLDAIAARPSRSDEDWLVILTADHGGKGRFHGGQSPEERAVFILEWEAGGGRPK
jgi:hypothetical protein